MYGCESWTIKKAEWWRIDAFELWYWRRFSRVLWTSRRSNQSIVKENSPEDSLEGLMLKLKLQYFGHLMGRTDSLEKTLMLGKIEGRRRRGWQRMRLLDSISDTLEMSLNKLLELVMDREAWHAGVAKSQTWLSDWTELINTLVIIIFPCYLLAPVHVPSHFSCAWLFENLWIVACQAPPSMGFSRQEYWSGVPLPSPEQPGKTLIT